MKIETPQILWHNGGDSDKISKGKNAPLYSVSMLESGICDDSLTKYGHVLATAGNTSEINLWRLSFRDSESKRILQHEPNTKIEHMLSLTRHERSVNTTAFSPDGLHLATAGDGGSILIWSVPPSKRGNQNGRHFWSTLTKEGDLSFRIVSSPCEGICDLSWSPDSKRFIIGSVDHCIHVYEDVNYDANQASPDKPQVESQWRPVYRNASDHTHFVQGVAYDPLGVYVASMGSDRTVRVYARKPPPKTKTKVLRPKDAIDGPLPPREHEAMVERLLMDSKLELGKGKVIKYREAPSTDDSAPLKKHYLFADESTVESFFRRLSWTTDGAFLVTPAALWHRDSSNEHEKENTESSSPSYATYLYTRHRYDEPCRVLPGLEKPSVVVRPSPVLYKLPNSVPEETKENRSEQSAAMGTPESQQGLPYRSVFAVLTLDSVLIYDTHHLRPLCIARGLHYAGLTDCTWSADGRNLIVCSTDGYVSILTFDENEFGEIFTPLPKVVLPPKALLKEESVAKPESVPVVSLPPCESGQAATLEARPAKRAKTRITPILISSPAKAPTTTLSTPTGEMRKSENVVSSETPKAAKKRIQPTLVSVAR